MCSLGAWPESGPRAGAEAERRPPLHVSPGAGKAGGRTESPGLSTAPTTSEAVTLYSRPSEGLRKSPTRTWGEREGRQGAKGTAGAQTQACERRGRAPEEHAPHISGCCPGASPRDLSSACASGAARARAPHGRHPDTAAGHLSSSDCVLRSSWAKASILRLSRALRKEWNM